MNGSQKNCDRVVSGRPRMTGRKTCKKFAIEWCRDWGRIVSARPAGRVIGFGGSPRMTANGRRNTCKDGNSQTCQQQPANDGRWLVTEWLAAACNSVDGVAGTRHA